MAAHMEFISLMRWKDERGYHEKGEVVTLPYESFTDKMDANRLVDYGVVAKNLPTRRSKRRAS